MIDSTKALLYERQAEIAKAVAHPLRMAVIDFLRDGERCVCEIAEHVGSERSNVSRHLSVMVRTGVLTCRKDGLKVFYNLRTPCIAEFLSCISGVVKQQAQDSRKLLSAL